MEQQEESAAAAAGETAQRKSYGSFPMGRLAEYLAVYLHTRGGGSRQAAASRRDGTARCTAYTGESSVYAQHAAARSDGCVAMQLPDHTDPHDITRWRIPRSWYPQHGDPHNPRPWMERMTDRMSSSTTRMMGAQGLLPYAPAYVYTSTMQQLS